MLRNPLQKALEERSLLRIGSVKNTLLDGNSCIMCKESIS